MKRTTLLALAVLGTAVLLGAVSARRYPYVSSALNKTRTMTELEVRILQNRVDTTPVPVAGGVFHVRKMDAVPQDYALLVKVDVALNTGQKPLVWNAKVTDRRIWSVGDPLYSLARARFGDSTSFTRGFGGLIVLVTMDGRPILSVTGHRTSRFLPNSSPADVAKIISEHIARFQANMAG